jgi:hypothetical protein
MRKPAVFVSSTCYDLKQLRADLSAYLENAGFEPVLSEYPSFPIDPDADTVANCRRAVEDKADIFVLIVGSRYGSIDDQGKSITNLEYLAAKAKGIPVYVFALRSTLDVLPLWRANAAGSFSVVADSPKLFEFLSAIRDSGERWVFPFDIAQDIIGTLRLQLAYLFADALALRMRATASGVLAGDKFKNISGRELRLIMERPRAWEYRLFSEAISRELRSSADLKRDWLYGVTFGRGESVSPIRFVEWVQSKTSEGSRIFGVLESLFNEALPKALGAPGQPGDPEAILYVASRFGAVYRSALQWKLDFYCVAVHDELLKLRSVAARVCDNAAVEIEQFAAEVEGSLARGLQAPAGGPRIEVKLELRITAPEMTEFAGEMERVSQLILSGKLEPH